MVPTFPDCQNFPTFPVFLPSATKLRQGNIYRLQRKLRKGNVFTPVSQSFCSRGGGVVVSASVHAGIHPLGRPPHDPTKCMLGYTPPLSACWNTHTHPAQCMLDTHNPPLPSAWWDTHPPHPVHGGIHPPLPPTATAADSTHPTGMHSCFQVIFNVLFF